MSSPEHSVASLYREQLAYREGSRSYVFDAVWGTDPYTVYVPDAATWDRVVPDWLRGRREEVVGRIAAESGHRVVETDTGYDGDPASRTADRPRPESPVGAGEVPTAPDPAAAGRPRSGVARPVDPPPGDLDRPACP